MIRPHIDVSYIVMAYIVVAACVVVAYRANMANLLRVPPLENSVAD